MAAGASVGARLSGQPVKKQALGKDVSAFSVVQKSRLEYVPPLPAVLRGSFTVKQGPPSTAAGNADAIQQLFPNVFGQPSVQFIPDGSQQISKVAPLKIGAVLSGGQAPGGHNVIAGIFDYLKSRAPGSTFIGFRGGPAGVMKGKYIEITEEYFGRDKIETPEQFTQAEETCKQLDLDGLVVIGGDDSNTNACLLAEYFRSRDMKTKVIGCPKTIDGDLKAKEVPTSFGFDTACKIYSEMIGNVMVDARSAGKYYHFVRLMGRAASHITLECALQTHPNIALIGEEVSLNKETLGQVTSYIADVVCKRAEKGRHYGVILIPEGLIDFIPEIQHLIAELNEILAHGSADKEGKWKEQLDTEVRQLYNLLPSNIQEQLLLDRDPHGNVQVAKIETEKMLISMVEAELEKRRAASQYSGVFQGQSHFFGYEGRCGLPTNFDANYCHALGYAAGALLQSNQTGLIASVGNLTSPTQEWTVGGTALTQLMDVERRHGKNKPVIKKAMVELGGPIQFFGPTADVSNFTLLLEQGVLQ
eukprot:jgi/Mesen1/7567/ME000392S06830